MKFSIKKFINKIKIWDGTNEVGIKSPNELKVNDADANISLGLIEADLTSIAAIDFAIEDTLATISADITYMAGLDFATETTLVSTSASTVASIDAINTKLVDGNDIGDVTVNNTTSNPVPVGDFFFDISCGNVPGYSTINKFGENPDIDTGTDPEDVWDYGGIYAYSTVADIDQVSSSDNADTQLITFVGLDENWSEVTQTKTLTGQTPVTLDTPLIRIYRAYNSGSADIAGDVYVSTNGATLSSGVPTVASTIRAMIRDGNNQTLMCIYTVPAGKTGYFTGGYVAMSKAKTATANFSWRARPFGGVFQAKSKISISSTGSSTWSYQYGVPPRLPEKTDILIRCEEVSVNDVAVSGGFDIVLVDN